MERRAGKGIVLVVALLLALVTACDGGRDDATQEPSDDRPQLIMPGGPSAVTVQLPAKKHQSYVHGSYTMCLDKPGEVKVAAVEFDSGSAEITGWALRPNPAAEGGEFAGDRPGATLATRGIENTEVLTRVCDGRGNSYELVLQLRTGESSTEGDGVVVRYTSDGREGTLALPDRVVLCVLPERPECV